MTARCSFCGIRQRQMVTHVARCLQAPQRARIGARLRAKSRTAQRKGVLR